MNAPCPVSVVVPVYNRRDLVPRAVRSLLEQEFDQEYEIIVVDDGSTDGSADVVDGIDPRVRVVRQANCGAAAARHAGINAARGELVTFLDSDDVALPNNLKVLYNSLRQHPQCVLSFALARNNERGTSKIQAWIGGDEDGRSVLINDPFEPLLVGTRPLAEAMNLMVYRDMAEQCSRRREFYRVGNDYDFQARLASLGPAVYVATTTREFFLQESGLSCSHGWTWQKTYGLCSIGELLKTMPASSAQKRLFGRRSERLWGECALEMIAAKNWRMLWRITIIALRYGRPWRMIRPFWWELDKRIHNDPKRVPRLLRVPAILAAYVRRVVRREEVH